MRKIVFHMQTTVNNRIANADGGFWEPFPWGEEETAYIAEQFSQADTWAMGRATYEAIVPWWDKVARGETPNDAPVITAADRTFAEVQRNLAKVVFSTTLPPATDRLVISGDLVDELTALKRQDGKDIMLSCGPRTLAPIASAPGVVDEYLLAVSPAVLSSGPQVFDGLTVDLGLELADAKVFKGGAIVSRYRVVHP
ncbi:dihydrofolate reductase family protein [Actinomadura sp. 9N215]|uniref:dihydrofolate reductase family protein n=1 Tax=Actinomadura sp. 9N215 TaxID=3375150 RepID=UPI00379FE0F4